MVYVHGVVGRLVQAVEDADAAADGSGGAEHGEGKGLLIDNLRAAVGEDQTAGSDLRNGGSIQALIGAEGIAQHSPVLGECRRVHHNEVILAIRGFLDEIDGILAIGSMAGRIEAVENHIPVNHRHCLAGTVHGIHMESAGGKGVYGEATSVTEEIQDIPACRIAAHKGTVLALVKEKARLLPAGPVHIETVAVLRYYLFVVIEGIGTVKITVNPDQSGRERGCAGALVIYGLQSRAIYGLQSLADAVLRAEHANRMGLHHADAVVIVDYEAREIVPLSVYQTITVGHPGSPGHPGEADGTAHGKGGGNALLKEVGAERGVIERKDTHGNGADLVMTIGKESTVRGVYSHDIPLGGSALYLRDGTREHPRMETAQGFLPALSEYKLDHKTGSSTGRGFFSLASSLRYISRHTQASVAA